MKYLVSSTLLLALLASALDGSLQASEPGQKGKIRILLTTGGHDFEVEPFYAMFDSMSNVEYTKAELPKDAGLLKPGLEKQYHVLVMYDMVPAIEPQHQKAFIGLLKTGIGVVSMHHNLGAHRNWDEYRKIIAGKFILADCEIDGQKYGKSTWSHDEHIKVTVADRDHPITKGLKDFEIHDETYGGYYTAPGARVLLKTDHPKNDPELAWVTKYGKSPVFFLMLGHDGKAYKNPNYVEILARGIRWAAGR